MKRSLTTILRATCILLLIRPSTGENLQKCLGDDFLTSNGTCVPCPFCPGGQGMDTNETVPTNEAGAPLACRKCKPCERGYFNAPENPQYDCIKCPRPCIEKNRKEYIPCGGFTRGQCGDFLYSEFVDKDDNLDYPSAEKTTTGTTGLPILCTENVRIKPSRAGSARGSEGRVVVTCLIVVTMVLVIVCVAFYVTRHIWNKM